VHQFFFKEKETKDCAKNQAELISVVIALALPHQQMKSVRQPVE